MLEPASARQALGSKRLRCRRYWGAVQSGPVPEPIWRSASRAEQVSSATGRAARPTQRDVSRVRGERCNAGRAASGARQITSQDSRVLPCVPAATLAADFGGCSETSARRTIRRGRRAPRGRQAASRCLHKPATVTGCYPVTDSERHTSCREARANLQCRDRPVTKDILRSGPFILPSLCQRVTSGCPETWNF